MSALVIETWNDLINLALKNAGVLGTGQIASAEDMNDSARLLNSLIGIFQRKRYLIYVLPQLHIPATGAQTYTVGPGGDFNVSSRPASIKSAFARQVINANPNQIDYPLAIITSAEDYDRIAMKSLQSFPQWLWYEASYPLGVIHAYPVITSQFSIYVRYEAILQSVEDLTATIDMPYEYVEALMYNLAVRLGIAYQLPASPDLKGLAKNALETLRSVNAQVPTLRMPAVIVGRNGNYNIFSDRQGVTG